MTENRTHVEALLVVAFGGPEKPADVRPFLQQVTRGRVPAQRLEAVARHYDIFGGKSPVNQVTHRQAQALGNALGNRGLSLPTYVGMRNWHPFLQNTVATMDHDGVKRAVTVIMSVFQSRSSWDQYQSEIADAIGKAEAEFQIAYTQPVFDHPGFIRSVSASISHCMGRIDKQQRSKVPVVFTVHSLPLSDPQVDLYVKQVHRSAELIGRELGHENWQIAYQSRSGRPQDPWLEPDVNDVLRDMGKDNVDHVVVAPIGFVCDNVEVLYDLDTQAKQTASEAGITLYRAGTVGDDPGFIEALADTVLEAAGVARR